MTIEEMRERKRELGYSNRQIADLSGLPLGTVMKVMSGATKSPRRETVEALERVLGPGSGRTDVPSRGPYAAGGPLPGTGVLRDGTSAWHVRGRKIRHTIEDYYALPEERRVELIDGIFYDMAAPTFSHQDIIGRIFYQLMSCQMKHPDGCRVFISPCDVQLDRDRFTMVQPDVMVVCDDAKIKKRVLYGAPDLAIEVMSPSSGSRDAVLKLNKYRKAGVREYWLVDPDQETVMVYDFEHGTFFPYTFRDTVPVIISGGECSVDFAQISAQLLPEEPEDDPDGPDGNPGDDVRA